MELFVTGILHNFGNDNINCLMSYSSIRIRIGDGNVIWDIVGILKDIGNGNIIWFCNYNCNHNCNSGLVTGILYDFGIDNGGICYRNFTLFWKR